MLSIPNELSILAQVTELLEDFSFSEPFYELNESSISMVNEATIPNNMHHGDVWGCDFEYNNITPGMDPDNPSDKKKRPCIIINDRTFGYVALRISHIEDKDPETGILLSADEIDKKYNTRFKYILQDWKNEGLTEPSYAYCIELRQLKYINSNNLVKYGEMSKRDFKIVLRKFNDFKASRDRKIVLFNQYLKFANYRYDSKGFFQTIRDIDKSGKSSLVSITNLISQLCHRLHIKYMILWTKLKASNNKQYNHFTCMYIHKNSVCAFRYFPQLPSKAELHVYDFITKFEDAVEDETNWIKTYYPADIVSASSKYLEDEQIKLWKESSNRKRKVEDFIRDLENL